MGHGIVVVGAGVIGASVAFHLTERGVTDVLVLDKGSFGEGGSSRSSALVRMHYSFAPEVRLAVRSREYFRHWEETVGRPGHYHARGFVRLVPADQRDRLEANVAMQAENGSDVRLVTADELLELAPGWNVEDVEVAAYEQGSGYDDGAGVASDFLARARERGVAYRSNTPATALELHGGRVTGVRTPGGVIDSGTVVVANGPWSPPLLASAGLEAPIESEFHEVALLANPAGIRDAGPVCIDGITDTYHRPEGREMTLVGTFIGPRVDDPDDYPQRVSDDTMAELARRASHRIPALADAGLARGITGIYDMTLDARPILGPVAGIDGLVLAVGFSGMGFKIAPAVGLVLSELLVDGRATTEDVHPFRFERFAEGDPIVGPFEYADEHPVGRA